MSGPLTAGAAPVLEFGEIDSTNAEARRRAEGGASGPLWLRAERQTAGRGRRGRSWEAGPADLQATLLVTLDRPVHEAALVSFSAALAVADLAEEIVGPGLVRLKWPNDLMVAGRKAAGVLLESGRSAGGLWLAIGMGINLATAPTEVERPATCLAAHLPPGRAPPSPAAALKRLDVHLATRLEAFAVGPARRIAEAFSARAMGLGAACVVRLDRETLEGVAEGLEDDGALRLRLADGAVRRITAGDVFFPAAGATGAA